MTPRSTLPQRLAVLAAATSFALAQNPVLVQGPSSSRTPYLVPSAPAHVVANITSVLTTVDLVPLTGGGGLWEFGGIPDGLGAYDNGDGTLTVLSNHELGNTSGVVRRHGARGAYVSEIVVDKATLAVLSGQDLVSEIVDVNGVVRSAANSNGLALNRFCSADLPPVSAFYNAASGLGTQERIFMNGEEGGATGYAVAHIATGPNRGRSHLLPKFNLSTNGSGLTGVGGWENILACPFPQDLTVVVGNNDGGTGIMSNSVAVYLGTKQATGNEVERAGLTNGNLYFVQVAGNPAEILNSTTRTTGITSGTRFALSSTASTTFSRPEDGAWNPLDPREFYFVTTDRLDTATSTGSNPTVGATGTANQRGMTRLWRLVFDDVSNPLLGGRVDLLIDGEKNGQRCVMFDNMEFAHDGRIYLNEDPGNSTYIGKVWAYDVAADTLLQVAKFDPARWGELAAAGGTPGAVSPWTNDKESTGIIDVTRLFAVPAGETWLLSNVQDHSTNAAVATASSVEGGQLLLIKVRLDAAVTSTGTGCGSPTLAMQALGQSLPKVGSTWSSEVVQVPAGSLAFVAMGLSNTSVNGTPLPLALDNYGLTGCTLYNDLSFGSFRVTTPTGPTSAQFDFAIPASQVLVGLSLHAQAWATDALANPGGLVLSNGLSIRIAL
jgi:hypothetical protein